MQAIPARRGPAPEARTHYLETPESVAARERAARTCATRAARARRPTGQARAERATAGPASSAEHPRTRVRAAATVHNPCRAGADRTRGCHADHAERQWRSRATADVDEDTPLLWVLRESLGLTGTKFGCGVAACGACTVHVNGAAARSCSVPAAQFQGQAITTIEGLAPSGNSRIALQAAWIAHQVPQCGYCQSGMIMAAAALLARNPAADGRRDRRGSHEHLPLRHVRARATRDPLGRGGLRGGGDMNKWTRRTFIATGGLVGGGLVLGIGGHCLRAEPHRPQFRRRARYATAHDVDQHRPRQHRHGARASLRDGHGRAHGAGDDACRGARSRLEPGARRGSAGARRLRERIPGARVRARRRGGAAVHGARCRLRELQAHAADGRADDGRQQRRPRDGASGHARCRRSGRNDADRSGGRALERAAAECTARLSHVTHGGSGRSSRSASSPQTPRSSIRRMHPTAQIAGRVHDRRQADAAFRHSIQGQRLGHLRYRRDLAGMLYATVAASPVFGATLTSVDASAASRPCPASARSCSLDNARRGRRGQLLASAESDCGRWCPSFSETRAREGSAANRCTPRMARRWTARRARRCTVAGDAM